MQIAIDPGSMTVVVATASRNGEYGTLHGDGELLWGSLNHRSRVKALREHSKNCAGKIKEDAISLDQVYVRAK